MYSCFCLSTLALTLALSSSSVPVAIFCFLVGTATRNYHGDQYANGSWEKNVCGIIPEPASHNLAELYRERNSSDTATMPVAMDTQQQNFWIENINKEAALRFAWQLRYSKKFAKESAAQKHQQQQLARKQPPALELRSDVSQRIKRLEGELASKPSSVAPPRSRTSSRGSSKAQAASRGPPRDMRPPSVATRAVLYDGISAHGEGRYAYLTRRKQLSPDQKYEFPVLSSCQYGWKILDFMDPTSKPSPFARTCVIRDSFYRTSGVCI